MDLFSGNKTNRTLLENNQPSCFLFVSSVRSFSFFMILLFLSPKRTQFALFATQMSCWCISRCCRISKQFCSDCQHLLLFEYAARFNTRRLKCLVERSLQAPVLNDAASS